MCDCNVAVQELRLKHAEDLAQLETEFETEYYTFVSRWDLKMGALQVSAVEAAVTAATWWVAATGAAT